MATLALQNGVDIKTVSGILGHYSAGFTLDTYAHVTTATQRQAANTMDSVLSALFDPFRPFPRMGHGLGQEEKLRINRAKK